MQVIESQLANDARGGDRDAFECLVRKLTPKLLSFFLKRGAGDAQELVQATWCRVVEKLHLYDPARSFTPWLFTLAHREWANELRKKHRRPAQLVDEPIMMDSDDGFQGFAEDLQRCLDQLSSEQRRIVVLRYWEELNLDEVGRLMNIPYGRLKGMAYRTVKQLRQCMGQRDLPTPSF